jgi:hypothetical protein
MSAAERVGKSVRETIKSTQEFIDSTKKSLQTELFKTTPKVEHALDPSLDEAGRALSNTLKSVEKKTGHEQLELLND